MGRKKSKKPISPVMPNRYSEGKTSRANDAKISEVTVKFLSGTLEFDTLPSAFI